MKYFLSLVLVSLVAVSASAQSRASKTLAPKETVAKEAVSKEGVKVDSAKLKAAFKELYPLIRPVQTIKEHAESSLLTRERMFKMQGVDSAKAHDSVMAVLDPTMDEKLYFDTYAANFTPEEMKALATFFKAPGGRHFLEVEPRLGTARAQVDQYINRTITIVTNPMRKPIERR